MNPQTKPDVEYLTSEQMKGLPFSEAVRVGRMLYLSGMIGTDSSMKLAPGGITAETRQAMENIKATLERYGSSLDHVTKVTVMMADMSEWTEMNKVYVTYFPKNLPARSALGANGLAFGARVEIECIAVLKWNYSYTAGAQHCPGGDTRPCRPTALVFRYREAAVA